MFIEYRLPEPKFEIIPGGFAVTVYSNTDQVDHKTIGSVVDNVVDNETNIIKLLYQNKNYSADEIAKILNKSERTIQRYLNLLIKKKLIQRIGPDKGGHWKIPNS